MGKPTRRLGARQKCISASHLQVCKTCQVPAASTANFIESHRVNSPQQQLGDAGVHLGPGHVIRGQQVAQVHALDRLATLHANCYFSNPPIDKRLSCKAIKICPCIARFEGTKGLYLSPLPTPDRSSQAWTNRFHKGRKVRLHLGRRTTSSDSVNMLLMALMKCVMSLGTSSCRQPSLVSNRITDMPETIKT